MINAVVLSGGGVKGAFQVGVLKQLFTKSRLPRGVQVWGGVSTGSINASVMSQGGTFAEQLDLVNLLYNMYNNMQSSDEIYKSGSVFTQALRAMSTGALYDPSPLRRLLAEHFTPNRPNSSILRIEVVNLRTGRTEVVTGDTCTVEHIIASCTEPGMFPAVNLYDNGDLYVDGGINNQSPLASTINACKEYSKKFSNEATIHIDVVLCNPITPKALNESPKRIDKVVGRSLSLALQAAFVSDLQYAIERNRSPKAGDKHIEFEVWAPDQQYGQSLKFDHYASTMMLLDGMLADPIHLDLIMEL